MIQFTAETYELLKDKLEFQPRGVIAVRGKGNMQVFSLIGKMADYNSTLEESRLSDIPLPL